MDAADEKSDVTRALLIRLWKRNTPILLERLTILDDAAAAACTEGIDPGLRARAVAQAHNLAGSLGMFGYAEGTNLARQIEQLLEAPERPSAQHLCRLTKALRANLFPPTN